MRHTSVSATASVWLGLVTIFSAVAADSPAIRWWVSSFDGKLQLAEQPNLSWITPAKTDKTSVVKVDSTIGFQTMLGMGSSLEPSTCWNLSRLATTEREQLMARLVDPKTGIGMNLMRLCIGTPDFTGDPWYSYDDMPCGETDPELKQFSIEPDRRYILPAIKLARRKNPGLLFFASPWSPPGWMKSTGTMIGGQLLPQHYAAYAEYFVRFIQAYEAEGIPIYAVTIQNEPGVDRAKEKNPKWHYPSCRWTGEQERDFIRDHLGPALRRNGLKTLIWCYDHNYNVRGTGDDPGIGYPRAILSDPQVAAFVNGVAFHGYEGKPDGMTAFHREFPTMPIYFTEGSVFGVDGAVELIERLRNWAAGYNSWVTMLDDHGKPNNGPFEASRTMVMLNPESLKPTYHFEYFMSGQFMKFVPRGAQRIESTAGNKDFANVAFRNPDDTIVLIVVNTTSQSNPFAIEWRDRSLATDLAPKSVATFVWAEK